MGSALNALTTAAGLVSMGVAAALGEAIGLRAMYVISGLITMSAGVIGLFVLKEPESSERGTAIGQGIAPVEECWPMAKRRQMAGG